MGRGPARSPDGCLAGIRQVVQRAALAASHLQSPKHWIADVDHLLSLVTKSYRRSGPRRWISGQQFPICNRPWTPCAAHGRSNTFMHSGDRPATMR